MYNKNVRDLSIDELIVEIKKPYEAKIEELKSEISKLVQTNLALSEKNKKLQELVLELRQMIDDIKYKDDEPDYLDKMRYEDSKEFVATDGYYDRLSDGPSQWD